ncbi:hypothetical protein [Roseicitreum antarcticum]|uniref:hypothetical protein n=1 Tax=Roseicitreum antarcticum TaxID=564137 RepID=UPI00295BCD6C|nr:hypothetical protein [Roseicitreum antarcticum]
MIIALSGNAPTSSAARFISTLLYSTIGGQGAIVSEPPVAHALSQSIAISGAAGGCLEHLAVDFMGSLRC